MKKETRIGILVLILIGAVGYLLFGEGQYLDYRLQPRIMPPPHEALKGDNEIRKISVVETNEKGVTLDIDLFFNGASGPGATLKVTIGASPEESGIPSPMGYAFVKPGSQTARVTMLRAYAIDSRYTTHHITAYLQSTTGAKLVEKNLDLDIAWEAARPLGMAGASKSDKDALYTKCVAMIDQGGNEQLQAAKRDLERILLADPSYVAAYDEIARVHMKTNWNRDGLAQAEQVLKTALSVDPKHADSHVLIGYVYVHQNRYAEAAKAFEAAEKVGTDNLWLYTNWGELLTAEKKIPQAKAMFTKAIDTKVLTPRNVRPQEDAYRQLIALLSDAKQWSDLEKVYQHRTQDNPDDGCYLAEYANFRLGHAGDYGDAIKKATEAADMRCYSDGYAKEILAKAYYTKWASLRTLADKQKEADMAYQRGNVLMADMAGLIYQVAASDKTAIVIPALKAKGIRIDTVDRNGASPLAHAVAAQNLAITQRLLNMGANVNQAVNPDGWTPLMLAAYIGNPEMAVLLLKHGADRKKKSLTGYTAETIAQGRGHERVLNILSKKSNI